MSEPARYVREWRPNKKQERFLSIPPTIFEGLYGGAAGGGKTEILLLIPILNEYYKHPKFQGIIFRRYFPEIEKSLEPRSEQWYKPLGATYNQQRHTWTFPSGARIHFGHMEKNKDATSHDTNEYQYIAFDELTAFEEFQYRYLLSRCRSSHNELTPFTRAATNPGNIGNTWVRNRFVEPYKDGGKILVDPLTNNKRIYIHANLDDNPYIDPGYRARLEILPEIEKKAKLYGDWWAFAGQVFTEFRHLKMPDEPENAIHVVEPFEIPSWWPKVLGVDWGYTAATWAGWFAISPDSRVYLYREYWIKKTAIKVWGADIARLSQCDENIRSIELDPSAWRNLGEEKTIAEQFMDSTGFTEVHKADNDRLGGKMLLHDLMRWKPRPPKYVPADGFNQVTADRILRMGGLDALREYEASFLPEVPETNIPRLQIFNTCPKVIEALASCVYDEARPEDVKEWDGDDPYDGLRYGVKGCDRYIIECAQEETKRQRLARVVNELHRTGNQTAFYRQMETLESSSRKVLSFGRHRAGPIGR